MTARADPSFERVAAFHPLVAAARRASRGYRRSPEVADFLLDLDRQVLQLERELLSGEYLPQPYRTFHIQDPKPRTISAAAFRDRVVHHALCAELEHSLERGAVASSFACRRGKGVLAALRHARVLAHRSTFVLKLDIRHFFETLSHDVLIRLLDRRVRDQRLRWLYRVFIGAGAPGSPIGRGLPIGNLTSQHFANFYLGVLDRLVTRGLRAPGYCRYMDDVLVFGADRAGLWDAHRSIEEVVTKNLKVELKAEVTRLLPVQEGIPFLGFVIFPGLVRFDRHRRRRWRAAMGQLHRRLDLGDITEESAQNAAVSLIGWARHGHTDGLRRTWVKRRTLAPFGQGGQ